MGTVAKSNAKRKRRVYCFMCMRYLDESIEEHNASLAHKNALDQTIYECETGEVVDEEEIGKAICELEAQEEEIEAEANRQLHSPYAPTEEELDALEEVEDVRGEI